MIFMQWGLINSPYENILQCIGFLQEVLVVVPLRHGPAEHLGRSECGRSGQGCWGTARTHSYLSGSEVCGTESVLIKISPEKPRSSQGTKASSWSWVVRWGWWDRTQYSCFFCSNWPAMCWLAFIPRAMLIPKCPLCFCNPQRPNPSLGSHPHCGLTEGGDFRQLLVVGNEKRFSSMMFLMLMGISSPWEPASLPHSCLRIHLNYSSFLRDPTTL